MKRIYNNIRDKLWALRNPTVGGMAKDEALRYLENAEDHFYINDGPAVKNLYELVYVMRDISDEQFEFHVNSEKNDFANWIADCVSDHRLAADVRQLDNKHSMAIKIAERYMYLLKSAKLTK